MYEIRRLDGYAKPVSLRALRPTLDMQAVYQTHIVATEFISRIFLVVVFVLVRQLR